METWFTHPMWIHNVCILMKFIPLYKGFILTIQDKCTNYTKSVQGHPLWRISINFRHFFFFVLPSKDCTLSWHTFLYHKLILCTLFNLHMTIQIFIPLMMFEGKFCFYVFHYFVNQTNGNMVKLPMSTHWIMGIWNLGHRTRYLH